MSTPTDRTLAHLLASLDGVWDTLRAVADWYEERGEQGLAVAYRWLAETKRHPRPLVPLRVGWEEGNWTNWNLSRGSDLPVVVAIELRVHVYQGCYPSLQAAFADAAQALVKAGEDGKGPLAGKVARKAERQVVAEDPFAPYTLTIRTTDRLVPQPGEHKTLKEARRAARNAASASMPVWVCDRLGRRVQTVRASNRRNNG